MSFQGNALYSPYGAAELKATYQRNMALGTLTAVSMVLITLGVSCLTGLIADAPITPVKPPTLVEINTTILPPPTFERQEPVTSGVSTKSVAAKVGTPEPIPDEVMPEEEIVIATRDQMAAINSGEIGPPGSIEGLGDISGAGSVDSYIPPSPDIVEFCEILPKLVYYEIPEYPRHLERIGIEGTVGVKALVDIDGSVKEAVVARSSDNTAMDEAAIRAAYKNKYTPGIQNGRPVLVWVIYRVEFVLER